MRQVSRWASALRRPGPWTWLLLALAAGAFCLTGMRGVDTFHHLAMGREIVRLRGFPQIDPFLFPLAGLPTSPPPYWLGSVLIYLSQAALGDVGPVLFAAVVGSVLALVLGWDSLTGAPTTWQRTLVALAPVALALAVFRPRAVARPEIVGLVLLALSAGLVRRHAEGRVRALWALPVLLAVWANLHPSAATGLVPLGALLAWGVLQRAAGRAGERLLGPRPSWKLLAIAGAVAVAAALALLATPSSSAPVQMALGLAKTLVSSAAGGGAEDEALRLLKHSVSELRPLEAADWLGPFGALVALAVLGLCASWRDRPLRDALVLAAFVALAITAVRFTVFAAVVAAPIAGRGFASVVDRLLALKSRARALGLGALGLSLAAALSVGLYGGQLGEIPFGFALDAKQFPVRATDYLLAAGKRGRFFNTFHFGGYLEWRLGGAVFQDGRGGLLPQDAAAAFAGPQDAERFAELDARYAFDALVIEIPTSRSLDEHLLRRTARQQADWAADRARYALVAFDDGGMLYLRRDGAYAELAARDEFHIVVPAAGLDAEQLADSAWTAAFVSEMERALREAPGCVRCRVQLGIALAASHQPARATEVLVPALGRDHVNDRFGAQALADCALALGDSAAARRYLELGIATGLAVEPLRRQLATLELQQGRGARAKRLLEANVEGSSRQPEDFLKLAEVLQDQGDAAGAHAARTRGRGAWLERQGAALAARGDFARAAEAYRSSIAEYEPSAAAHAGLGEALHASGDPRAAVAEHRRAIALDSDLPEGWLGLGLALRATGDVTGARQALRRFLALEPRTPRALEVEKLMSRAQ